MRAFAMVVLAAGCAGEGHGGGGPPAQVDDWSVRYPAYPDSAGPIVLDATTPTASLHLRSSIVLTTSSIYQTNENVGLRFHLVVGKAKVGIDVYPEGGDPMTLPGNSGVLGSPTSLGPTSEHIMYMKTFQDCAAPCVRTEDYHVDLELLEGDSTTVTWDVYNGVRLHEPYGENVPAAEETLTIEPVTGA